MSIKRRQILRGSSPPPLYDGEFFQDTDTGDVIIGHNGSVKQVSYTGNLQTQIDAIARKKILTVPDELTGSAGKIVRVNPNETGFIFETETSEFIQARNDAQIAAGAAQSSSSSAASSASAAAGSETIASQKASDANLSAIDAAASAASAAIYMDACNQHEINAAAAAQVASMANAPAYVPNNIYSFPDVVAYTDGATYRCIGTNVTGENPLTSSSWARLAIVWNDFFETDENGDAMPTITPVYSNDFELDSNGDIMPF